MRLDIGPSGFITGAGGNGGTGVSISGNARIGGDVTDTSVS